MDAYKDIITLLDEGCESQDEVQDCGTENFIVDL